MGSCVAAVGVGRAGGGRCTGGGGGRCGGACCCTGRGGPGGIGGACDTARGACGCACCVGRGAGGTGGAVRSGVSGALAGGRSGPAAAAAGFATKEVVGGDCRGCVAAYCRSRSCRACAKAARQPDTPNKKTARRRRPMAGIRNTGSQAKTVVRDSPRTLTCSACSSLATCALSWDTSDAAPALCCAAACLELSAARRSAATADCAADSSDRSESSSDSCCRTCGVQESALLRAQFAASPLVVATVRSKRTSAH